MITSRKITQFLVWYIIKEKIIVLLIKFSHSVVNMMQHFKFMKKNVSTKVIIVEQTEKSSKIRRYYSILLPLSSENK